MSSKYRKKRKYNIEYSDSEDNVYKYKPTYKERKKLQQTKDSGLKCEESWEDIAKYLLCTPTTTTVTTVIKTDWWTRFTIKRGEPNKKFRQSMRRNVDRYGGVLALADQRQVITENKQKCGVNLLPIFDVCYNCDIDEYCFEDMLKKEVYLARECL